MVFYGREHFSDKDFWEGWVNPTQEQMEELIESYASIDTFSYYITEEDDPYYEEARKIVIENKEARVSLLRKKLRIGFSRGQKLIDLLKKNRVVGYCGPKLRSDFGGKSTMYRTYRMGPRMAWVFAFMRDDHFDLGWIYHNSVFNHMVPPKSFLKTILKRIEDGTIRERSDAVKVFGGGGRSIGIEKLVKEYNELIKKHPWDKTKEKDVKPIDFSMSIRMSINKFLYSPLPQTIPVIEEFDNYTKLKNLLKKIIDNIFSYTKDRKDRLKNKLPIKYENKKWRFNKKWRDIWFHKLGGREKLEREWRIKGKNNRVVMKYKHKNNKSVKNS